MIWIESFYSYEQEEAPFRVLPFVVLKKKDLKKAENMVV